MDFFVAVLAALLLLLVGAMIRGQVAWLRRIFLPASIVAGALGLVLGPQILGRLSDTAWFGWIPENGLFPGDVVEAWRDLPGVLINVVFASLFIGKTIPGLRQIWLHAGPQVALGQSIAWGQYVLGLLLAMVLLVPVFDMHPASGALIEIGFEGGHGTAAGMASAFEAAGFAEGSDLALGLATIGLICGVIIGTILINWASRHDKIAYAKTNDADASESTQADDHSEKKTQLDDADLDEAKKRKQHQGSATDAMSLQLALIAVAIAVGWVLLRGLQFIEQQTWGGELFTHLPLFPLAMIGGLLIQITIQRLGLDHLVVRSHIARAGGTALDLTIVAALASMSLAAIGKHILPVTILALVGTGWCVFCVLVLAPRIIPRTWFERGIGDFGQSMGMTISGLLLMRMADPNNRSGAVESFGYKQLLFEPIVGGGLFTGMSVTLIQNWGPWPVLGLCSALLGGWLCFGLLYFGPQTRKANAGQTQHVAGHAS